MRKATHILLALIVAIFVLAGPQVPRAFAVSWYNVSWGYRKSHTVVAAAGAGTNYQMKITVNYGSGTDSTNNVFLGSKGNTNFGDLFFTDGDGVTPLSYWVQSETDSSNAVVWVKIPDNISSSNATIYIYYGNAGATSASNGVNTFLFFDDFNGGSLDLAKWTKEALNGSITQSGGVLTVGGGTSGGAPYGWSSLGSSPSYTGFADNAVMYSAQNAASSIGEVAIRGNFAGNTGYKARSDARAGEGHGLLMPPYVVGSWNFIAPYSGGDGSVPTVGTWYTYEFRAVGSALSMYVNGTLVRSVTDSNYAGPGEISLQNHYGDHTSYDWVAVRKLVATEPTNGAWGSEETAPVSVPSRTIRLFEGFKVKLISGSIKVYQR